VYFTNVAVYINYISIEMRLDSVLKTSYDFAYRTSGSPSDFSSLPLHVQNCINVVRVKALMWVSCTVSPSVSISHPPFDLELILSPLPRGSRGYPVYPLN
jgi:hypothetical protein